MPPLLGVPPLIAGHTHVKHSVVSRQKIMSKPLARIGQRFTAQFLDDLVALAVGVVVYLAAGALGLPLELAILSFFLYLLLCDGLPGGQSLGKRFTKTAVVQVASEKPCSYWQWCLA